MKDSTKLILMGAFIGFFIGFVLVSLLLDRKERALQNSHHCLSYYQEQYNLHADSAQYFKEKYEKDFKLYADTWADPTRWDSLRTVYDTNLREAIHRELTR